jgi:hypothetical protein
MQSILNSFTSAGRARNADGAARSSPAISVPSSPGMAAARRPLDEKLFNGCVDLLETFAKKAASDPKFVSALANSTSIHSFPSSLSINNDVDTVVASLLSSAGTFATKRGLLDGNSPVVLWLAFVKVLDTCPPFFSPRQCEELRDANEGTFKWHVIRITHDCHHTCRLLLSFSRADTLSLLASGLTLFQQHLLGALFTAIEAVARDNGNTHALNALARSAARAVLRPPASAVRYTTPPHYCYLPSLLCSYLCPLVRPLTYSVDDPVPAVPVPALMSFATLAGAHDFLFPYGRAFAKRLPSPASAAPGSARKLSPQVVTTNPLHPLCYSIPSDPYAFTTTPRVAGLA